MPVSVADAVALLAWAAASGGARGRRRGAATGRFEAWWVLATLTAQDDDWPVDPGAAAADLRWWMWEPGAHAGDVEPGWVCRLAVEDPLDGLAWALNATDRLVDAGRIRTTAGERFGTINAANLRRAHALVESGRAQGKVVLQGF